MNPPGVQMIYVLHRHRKRLFYNIKLPVNKIPDAV